MKFTRSQGKLAEVYFEFNTIEEMIHIFHNSISTGLLGDVAVSVMRGYAILILKIDISIAYMSIHPHRMMASLRFIEP